MIYGYTDDEWDWMWNTMKLNGAWDVPAIKDDQGNRVKDNLAPELLIKFAAHDLKCHIVVLDLTLDTIQFCSGNQLRSNNVIFDSPLILYSTENHFQSVFPIDQEYFIELARSLEEEHNVNVPGIRSQDNGGYTEADLCLKEASTTKIKTNKGEKRCHNEFTEELEIRLQKIMKVKASV